MITRSTLFILGAGASHPFGFPTGAGLKSLICGDLRNTSSNLHGTLVRLGHEPDTLALFRHEFEHSALLSIDSFLAIRPTLDQLGRQIIVAALLPFQEESTLYSTWSGGQYASVADWYHYLYNIMRNGATRPEDIVSNRVRFITFNYDNSLERFFFNALRSGFNLPDEEAYRFARQIPVHHMYGSLATHERDRFSYRHVRDPNDIRSIAGELKVMPSERPERDEACVEAFGAAESFFFLGFGYDDMNCHRLGTSAGLASNTARTECHGTALGLTREEQGLARQRLASAALPVQLEDMTCLGLLRERVMLLVNP